MTAGSDEDVLADTVAAPEDAPAGELRLGCLSSEPPSSRSARAAATRW